MIKNHFESTDNEFELEFKKTSFAPSLFNHEAHLRLAWIHIGKYGVEKAIINICAHLKTFVASIDGADKYNETVTVAAIRAVQHFMNKSETKTFSDFISENARLKNNLRELLSTHYSTDIFSSAQAKLTYLEPELIPFD